MQRLHLEGPGSGSCYRRLRERSSNERMTRGPQLPSPRAQPVGKGLQREAAGTTFARSMHTCRPSARARGLQRSTCQHARQTTRPDRGQGWRGIWVTHRLLQGPLLERRWRAALCKRRALQLPTGRTHLRGEPRIIRPYSKKGPRTLSEIDVTSRDVRMLRRISSMTCVESSPVEASAAY